MLCDFLTVLVCQRQKMLIHRMGLLAEYSKLDVAGTFLWLTKSYRLSMTNLQVVGLCLIFVTRKNFFREFAKLLKLRLKDGRRCR